VTGDDYHFRFEPRYRLAGLPFGITPATTRLCVGETELQIVFGLWWLRTPLTNIRSVATTGPFRFIKTAGPPHLSFADKGVTFATNGELGVCLTFNEPVAAIDPTGTLRHPGATVTVADVADLTARLSSYCDASAAMLANR